MTEFNKLYIYIHLYEGLDGGGLVFTIFIKN